LIGRFEGSADGLRTESEDVWAGTLWNAGLVPLQWGVVIGASLAAAFTDLRSRLIPNVLTMPLFAAGVVTAFVIGGLPGLADAVAASLVLTLPYLLLYAYAAGGAGDAKMMAALGAWLGVVNGLVALVTVSLAGVVLACAWIWAHRGTSVRDMPAMPYGVAICLGVSLAGVGTVLWRL
jgi:prepilin signal peptidase PulO-like enzyme (type II secretory pathway)